MDILKHGTFPNQGLVLKGVCDYCGCEFRCVAAECTYERPTPQSQPFYKHRCPSCSFPTFPEAEKA